MMSTSSSARAAKVHRAGQASVIAASASYLVARPEVLRYSEEQAGGKSGGWFKAILTSIFGLFSGACLMYLSPLVDKVIKPSKPVANFAYQAQGLKVTFQNRSTGGQEGWWDFGDGSALEPFMP